MENILEGIQTTAQVAWEGVTEFMQRDLTLFELDLKMWMIIAAGAALISIILILILVISGAKKKKRRKNDILMDVNRTEMGSDADSNGPTTLGADDILSIGDEPTVNLEEQIGMGGIVMARDAETTDLPPQEPITEQTQFLVQVQMHYNGMVSEPREMLSEGQELVIGRGEGPDVTIHTNPADTSVSHRHGVLFLRDEMPWYRDESRNGTSVNGGRALRRGEETELPLQRKIQLEMGTHKVLLFIVKQ